VVYGLDSAETRDYGVDLDLALGRRERLTLGVGQTRTEGGLGDIHLDSYTVGLRTQRFGRVEAGLEYRYWGEQGEFTLKTLEPSLVWQGEAWSLGLYAEYRDHFTLSRPIAGVRQPREMESKGWRIQAGYMPSRGWGASIEHAAYEFDTDLTQLNTPAFAFLLSTVRGGTIASTLSDRVDSFEVGYSWPDSYLGLAVTRSISAINLRYSDTFGLRHRFFPAKWLSVEMEGGISKTEGSNLETAYGRVSLSYHW
ncbi:MAG: hypothetical protein AAB329_05025, partial [Pseudomonadota bacterium]